MALPTFFRIPRPKTFLYLMSLRTGTQLIILTNLLNKATSIYGILALLTSVHLSPLQLSMYIYSILVLLLTLYLAPHIRTHSVLQCLALAWLYVIDTLVNAAYTAAFGLGWFVVLAQHMGDLQDPGLAPGGDTIGDTAGFTNPTFTVTSVDIIATPAPGVKPAQDAVAVGSGDASSAVPAGQAPLSAAVFQSGSIASITIVSALWVLRLYFALIVLAYVRFVLRQHIHATLGAQPSSELENPFAASRPDGQGWQGRLGRAMSRVPRSYWLGADDTKEWPRSMGGKVAQLGISGSKMEGVNSEALDPPGVVERERRRRSGTGPPLPTVQLPTLNVEGL